MATVSVSPAAAATCDLDCYLTQADSTTIDMAPLNNTGNISYYAQTTPTDGSVFQDVVVGVEIYHSWAGDVRITLAYDPACGGPTVGPVTLLCRLQKPAEAQPDCSEGSTGAPYGCPDSLAGVYWFADNAPAPMLVGDCPNGGGPIVPGCFQVSPQSASALFVFDGQVSGGCWYLGLADHAVQDFGEVRSWTVGSNAGCGITKRAFLSDGTPVASGADVPTGTEVTFLLYVNNRGPAFTDLSLQDVLASGFTYIPASLHYTDTVAACAADTCTAGEEAAILAASRAGTLGTEAVDGDPVSFAGSTMDVGNQSVANARADVPAGSVWAVSFNVRVD